MKISRLKERLLKKEEELVALEALKDQAISSGGVTEWESSEGDHSSRVRSISLSEIQTLIKLCEKEIDDLEDRIDALEGNGSGKAFYVGGAW